MGTTGGQGGNGANDFGGGGGGGAGGYGYVLTADPTAAPALNVNVTGGTGGTGGNGRFNASGIDFSPGVGGDGGIGLFANAPATVTVGAAATVQGGTGGAGGQNRDGSTSQGLGGAGIVGSNLNLTVIGTVSGGTGRAGQADALEFTGGTNSLTLSSGGTAGTLNGNIDVTGTLQLASGSIASTVANQITGTGALTLTQGVVTLEGNNTYSGGTTVDTNTRLVLSTSNNAAGSGNITLQHGSALGLTNVNITNIVSGSGDPDIDVTGASSMPTYTGDAGTTFNILGQDNNATTDVLTVTTANATFPGTVNVGGTAGNANVTLKGGAVNSFGAAPTLSVATGSVLDLGGFAQSVSALTGGGTVTNSGAAAATLTNEGASSTFSGIIQNGAGTTALTEDASGNTLTLTGNNTYTGATTITAGTLALSGTGSIADSNAVNLATGSTFDISATTGGATIVTLGNTAAGQTGGVTLGTKTLTLSNASTTFAGVIGAAGDTGGLTVSGGTEVLTGANVYTGLTSAVTGGTVQLGDGGTTGSVAGNIFTGTTAPTSGTVAFDRSDVVTVTTIIYGAGTVNQIGTGTVNLNYTNTAALNFTGTINVTSGTLAVNGVVGDVTANAAQLTVNGATAILHGTGTFDGNVTVTQGTVSPGTGNGAGLLTVAGNYTLGANANSVFELGTSGVVDGPTNDLVSIGKSLTLGGTLTLNDATDTPLTSGIYRLYTYDTSGTGNAAPSGAFANIVSGDASTDVVLLTDTVNHHVDALLTNGQQVVQFWDGADTVGNGTVDGGTGTWNAANTNWTFAPLFGQPGINEQWLQQVGVFEGTAGTVTVAGSQNFQGLQFITGGYLLTGGAINATGDVTNAAMSFINVADGQTATINSNITGNAGVGLNVNTVGSGTLQIGGTASYPGLTQVNNGTLEVLGTGAITASSGLNNLALFAIDAGGSATFGAATNSGTINTAGTFDSTTGGLSNQPGATVNANAGVVNGAIDNFGTFNVNGTVTSNAFFTNEANAALNVTGTGNYTIAQLLTNSGAILVSAGGVLTDTAGGVTNTSTGTITNDGTVNDVLNNAGLVTNNGTYNATVASNTGTIINNGFFNGDVDSNTGTVDNGGTWTTGPGGFNNNGGTLNTTGTLNASAGGLTNTGTVNARGTINGPIANNAGFFNLSGNLIGDNTFTNAGPATLDVGGNAYSGATTLDNFGTVNVSGGSIATAVGVINENGGVFNSNGSTVTAPTFTNAGRLSMANGTVGDVTRINGNYVATGPNATLAVDVDLRNTAPRITDQLVVNGTVAGNTRVDFSRSLQGGSQINPNIPTFVGGTLIAPTPIVISNGGTGTFTPAQGTGSTFATNGGLVQYQLQQTSPGNYSIVSGANTGAITPIATSLSSAFGAISTSFFQSSSAFVVPASGNGPDQFTYGPWIRISGGAADIDSTGSDTQLGQTSQSKVDTTFEGFQAGFDSGLINVDKTNTNFHIGVTTGIVGADATEKKASNTDVNFSIPFVGIYGAVKHEDFSADVTYRHDFVDLRVAGGAVQQATHISAEGNSIYGNLLYGIAADKFSIIPSLGLGYSHYDIDKLPTILGGTVSFRDFDSLLGRLGVQVGRTIPVTDKFAVQPFVTGAIWHEFEGNTIARFSDPSGLFDQISTTRVGTFGQVGVGISAQLVPVGFTAFLRGDFRFGDKLNGQVGTLGVRYSF